MNEVHVTYVTEIGGDWAALYLNGADSGVEQNHSLDLRHVLEALVGKTVVSVAHLEVDSEEAMAEWMGVRGFPYNLSEIPQEARTS